MAARNVTLTLDEELLVQARILAARRRTSVSGLVREQLEALVGRDRRLREGARKARRFLESRPVRIGERLPGKNELHRRVRNPFVPAPPH